MNDPETQEAAVLQALVTRACAGVSDMSLRQIAKVTGLSRRAVNRTLEHLQGTDQLRILKAAEPPNPTMWEIPGQRGGPPMARNPETVAGNAVPTMPYQLLLPSGVGSSWCEQVYRQLTRAHSERARGAISVSCVKCCDTGYYLEKVSEEYSRKWLHTCDCEAGSWHVIPEAPEYEPESHIGLCLMCENTGWVILTGGAVQPCYSCRKTWS